MIADSGYQGAAAEAEIKAATGMPLEIVKRSDKARGFKVLVKR